MSVQLILYPQSYNGTFNTISSSPTEFVVNGITFANLNASGTYTSSSSIPYVDALGNAYPSVVNTWYRLRTNTSGTPDYPSVVSGNLELKSVAGTGSSTGVYQQLSNLTVGAQYTLTINIDAAVTGSIIVLVVLGQPSPITYNSGGTYSVATQITHTFTAVTSNDIVLIGYDNTVDETVVITDTSIQPVIGAIPSGSTSILENGQVICDLYEDEDLPLTLSVDDFKNVAEKVQSYSKAFNLPATKRNNKIFDNIFEITRSDDGVIFNAYKKTQCVLSQDGFVLFEGYLRLLDVTSKEGETSYNVNLYSEVVALADFLKDRAFRDLDFSELEHDYNFSKIMNSWQGILGLSNPLPSGSFAGAAGATTTSVVRYPFVNWNNQYSLDASLNPVLPNLESSFRPFINIKYLIERIFENTPFSYTSSFFNSTDFNKLFMDFNWGAGNSPYTEENSANNIYYSSSALNYAPNGTFGNFELINNTPLVNYDNTTNKFTETTNNVQYDITYYYEMRVKIASSDYSARWLITRASGVEEEVDLVAMQSAGVIDNVFGFGGSISVVLQTGDTLEAQFSSNTTNGIVQNYDVYGSPPAITSNISVVKSILSITSNIFLQTLRGEIGQWDFLKGLITMFNLVTLPDEENPNNIIIEPYVDVFTNNTNEPLNWTDKIDIAEMKLEPLTELNKNTIFKFVEDEDDFAFTNYKNQVGGHLYGSKKYDAGNEFNILEGLDEIVAEPFAATVVKPLFSHLSSFSTPALYAYNPTDQTSEGFDNSPRIMYNNGVKSTGASYSVPAQNGVSAVPTKTDFLQFSHLSDIPTIAGSRDFHFGECQLLVGSSTPDNLFNLYWLPYYAELYNPNTRIMTIKVDLKPSDINTFKFNDTVYIKNRVFRVNKIDYKPNDLSNVEFILIP